MPIVLTITMDDRQTGVTVEGPVDQKTVCYAMLELARDAIVDHANRNRSTIIASPMGAQLPPPPSPQSS
jgi:hypothetical protein